MQNYSYYSYQLYAKLHYMDMAPCMWNRLLLNKWTVMLRGCVMYGLEILMNPTGWSILSTDREYLSGE